MKWRSLLVLSVATSAFGLVVPAAPAAAECVAAARTPIAALPWAQQWLRPERLWPLSQGGGVTVAVLSTGVDASVPQLRGRVDPGIDLFSGAKRADDDCTGDGTFLASLVAANQRTGVGFAGVAPRVRVLPVRVTGDPSELTPSTVVADAIRRSAERGADVIVLGTPIGRAGAVLQSAVEFAAERNALVVAAATRPSSVGLPDPDPQITRDIVTVGGINPDGTSLTDFASPVDIFAPGANLTGTGVRGPGHVTEGGSTLAAGFVAGAAALVKATHPTLTAAQVRHRLLATADRLAAANDRSLNVYAAVTAVLPEETTATRPAVQTAGPATVTTRSEADLRAYRLAVGIVGGAALAAAVTLAVALLWPRARRRKWRPARS